MGVKKIVFNLINYIKKSKKDGLFLKSFEMLSYIVMINIGYLISFKYEFLSPLGYATKNVDAYYKIWIYISVAVVFITIFNDVYKMIKKTIVEIIATMTIVVVMINVTTLSIAFIGREFALPRSMILQASVIQLFGLVIIKLIFVKLLRLMRGRKYILVIAPISNKKEILEKIFSSKNNMDRVKYYVDPQTVDYNIYLNGVDKIFVSEYIDASVKDDVITASIVLNKSLYIVPKTFEIAIYRSDIIQFSDVPTFKVDNLQLSLEKMIVKRIFDVIVSSLALILLFPIIMITSLLILITDGRPVFYLQERITIDNKKFNIVKFRSMIKEAEKSTGAVWASYDDKRVTKLGKILRKFWIDELPQLFNVLKGDMSLVGPRPERAVFIDEFKKNIPDFHYRLTVKAGVTGLAQVLGKYSTTPEYKIKYDLMYIRNASLYYDVIIIIETVKKIIIGTLQRGENSDDKYDDLKEKLKIYEIENNGVIEYKYK